MYLKISKSKSKFTRTLLLISKLILINIRNELWSLLLFNINLYISKNHDFKLKI